MRKTTLHRTTIVITAFFLAAAIGLGVVRNTIQPSQANQTEQAYQGESLFQENGCSQCHFTDSTKTKHGPGLAGLFDRSELPVSGREVTEESIRTQLIDPIDHMPSFADRLSEKEIEEIISYLRTL
ncbi:MAG: c-type cytochrome [Desulfovermiculus sp.]